MSEEVLLSLLCPLQPAPSCHASSELTKPTGKARASFIASFQHVFQPDPPALALLQAEGFPLSSALRNVWWLPEYIEVRIPHVGAGQLWSQCWQRLFQPLSSV